MIGTIFFFGLLGTGITFVFGSILHVAYGMWKDQEAYMMADDPYYQAD